MSRFVCGGLGWQVVSDSRFVGLLHALLMHLLERRGSQTIIWRPNDHHDCFLGSECEPASRGSFESLNGLHSPHPLPAECCKGQPRKGVGEMHMRQPYCHTLCALECWFPQGGNAVHFLFLCFLCLVRRLFAVFCRSPLLRVVFF